MNGVVGHVVNGGVHVVVAVVDAATRVVGGTEVLVDIGADPNSFGAAVANEVPSGPSPWGRATPQPQAATATTPTNPTSLAREECTESMY